jgi:hypothetical protein
MLVMAQEATDFWGIVFPGYIGAIGGAVSSVVGVIAFVLSLRNRNGVKQIAGVLNARAGIEETGVGARALPSESVSWRVERAGRSLRLANRSAAAATLLSLVGASTEVPLPVEVGAGGSIPFSVDRSLVAPTVTAVLVEWTEAGARHTVTLWV